MNNIVKPKAIIFDWDNTLIDTWNLITDSLNITFKAFGKPIITVEEAKRNVHSSLRDVFPQIFGNDLEKATKLYYSSYYRMHLDHIKPLKGAEDTLNFIKQKGIFTSIVSNKRGDTLRKEISHLGWGTFFNSAIGSLDANEDKPSPAPVHLALKNSKLNSYEQVWFIGDTSVDIICAKNSGCVSILFGDAEYDADMKVKDHSEFLKLLANLN